MRQKLHSGISEPTAPVQQRRNGAVEVPRRMDSGADTAATAAGSRAIEVSACCDDVHKRAVRLAFWRGSLTGSSMR